MNDLFARLRAADPQPTTPEQPSELDVAAVLRAARTADGRHQAPPTRLRRRTILLAAAAGVVGAAAVPTSSLLRGSSAPTAQAAMLKDLAVRVAAQSEARPAGKDFLYRKGITEDIDLRVWLPPGSQIHPDVPRPGVTTTPPTPRPTPEPTPWRRLVDEFVRLRSVQTLEQWDQLVPEGEDGLQYLRTDTSGFLNSADAQRYQRMPADARKMYEMENPPPYSWSAYEPLEAPSNKTRGTFAAPTPKFVRELPTDPAELERRVRKDPSVRKDDTPIDFTMMTVWYEEALVGLLSYLFSPPKLRAAALMLLAESDGGRFKVVGERKVGKRTALALWSEGYEAGEEALIDRETGAWLGSQTLLSQWLKDYESPAYDDIPVGTALWRHTTVEFGYVAKVKQRP